MVSQNWAKKIECYWTEWNIRDQILKKCIFTSLFHLNQSTNYLSKEEKKWRLNNLKVQKAYFDYSQANDDDYKNLKTTTQLRKKVLIVFDDKISLLVAFLFLRKNKSFSRWFVLKRNKTQHSICFFITILFESA